MRGVRLVQQQVWILEMSVEPAEETEGEEEEEKIDFKPRLLIMIYNQPTILFYIFEVLFELLEARGIMNEEEAEALISEAMKRWRDGGGQVE